MTTPTLSTGRIAGLNGLRAIAVSLVLVSHAAGTAGLSLPRADLWLRYGAVGVDVFFVLSGFLITLLLVRETDRTGTTSLRAFWVRRALRILPAYLAYLLFVAILSAMGAWAVGWADWAAALTYTVNFRPRPHDCWPIAHLWSLCVEEHFYLLWPVLFAVCRRRASGVLLAVVALSPLVRYIFWLTLRDTLDIKYATPARMDSIAVGCLLAFLLTGRSGGAVVGWARRRQTTLFACACLGVALSLAAGSLSGKFRITLSPSGVALCVALGILSIVADPNGRMTRLLELRPVVWVGVLSYSLYLWQQLFLDPHRSDWWCRWPVNLACAFGCAIFCHYFVERPFLRLKRTSATESPLPGSACDPAN